MAGSSAGFNSLAPSEIALSWTTDDLTVASFEVRRAEEGGDPAPVATQTAQTFRDTGLAEGTTYLYEVRAFDGQEFSEPSDQLGGRSVAAATMEAYERHASLSGAGELASGAPGRATVPTLQARYGLTTEALLNAVASLS